MSQPETPPDADIPSSDPILHEPYRLEIIGQIIGLTALYGLLVQPMWKLYKYLSVPGRLDQVKKVRLYATFAVVTAVVLAVLFVPLPYRIFCPMEIEPHDAETVHVVVPGRLEKALVKPGQHVEAGQPLLRIDPTKADASLNEGRSKELTLRASIARLEAESRGTPLVFPPAVASDREVVRNETQAYLARRQALEQSTATLKRSKALLEREIAMTQPMVERGLVAEVELLRMQRQFNELDLQASERNNKYRAEAAAELSRSEGELAQVTGLLAARKDQVDRTVIRAPLRGTVKNVRVNTIGGVIQPGQDIMEIVPLEEQLLVEAKIAPREVAFLRPGLPAKVKLTAYDYTVYGALDGVVELISPDTLRDDRKSEEASYYRVLVRTTKSALSVGGRDLPIIPGMTATVEVRTGEKSVLDYLLKPVLRSREALRER